MKLEEAIRISKVEFSLSPKSKRDPDGWKIPGAIRPYYNDTHLVCNDYDTQNYHLIKWVEGKLTYVDVSGYLAHPDDYELLAMEDCWEPIY
jgi:hypothetical protein